MGKGLGEIIEQVFFGYRTEIAEISGEGSVEIRQVERQNYVGNWTFEIYADRLPRDREYPRTHSELGYMKPMVASFSLQVVPGCHAGIISRNVWIPERYAGKGLGTLLNQMRIDACKEAEYGFMMACVDFNNKVEEAILKKNGWIRQVGFKTQYSHQKMGLWTRRLRK